MAMPASGCLGILSCPGSVACTSISQAVDGNVTPPKSLCALSVTAGKSAPHGMTEFYGYGPTPKVVNLLCLTCTGNNTITARATSCLCVNPAMSSGECYCPTFSWCLFNDLDYGVFASFCVSRDGVCIECCAISPDGSYSHSGSFSTCIPSGEVICIMTCARRGSTVGGNRNEACVCLLSLGAGGSSNITKGVTRTIQTSTTCGAIP